MEFDDILTQHVGTFGLYQLIFYVGVTSIGIQMAIGVLEYAFIGATPTHWCHVPELNTYNFSQSEIEKFVSPPDSKTGCNPCFMYVRDYENVTEEDIQLFLNGNHSNAATLETTDCVSWTYDESQYHSTVVTEWDLVCGREWLMATSQSVFMAGQFSVVFSGYLADKHGRRVAVLAALFGHTVARVTTALSANFYMFVIGRFILSMSDIGWYTSVYVFGIEIVGPKWRVLSGAALYYFWLLGYVVQSTLAYFVRDWRMLIAVGTVLGLPYLLHLCFLQESPRWLLANGKAEKARKILKKMAKTNNKSLPAGILIQNKQEEISNDGAKITDLFKSWYFIKISLVFFFQWNAITLVYYGLVFYLPTLGGNPYMSLALSGLVEVPAVLYSQFAMDTRLGRKWNLILCFLSSGCLLLLILVLPNDINWLIIGAAILGKWGVSANWSFLYMITSEVYPTTLRNVGLSTCSMLGRFGGLISPFISQMAIVHPYLPAIVMGVLAVVAGLLGLLLPETRGIYLPDTVKDATGSLKSEITGISSESESLKENSSADFQNNKVV